MIYAQFKSGQKLHLVYEPGEGYRGVIVRAGQLSWPLCGKRNAGSYRMTINVPLGHSCRNCWRIYNSRHR
jgi:hypothetical protein